MTAVNVATRPSVGRSWGNGPVGAIALTVGLVAGIAVGALALRPATASTQAAAPAAVAPTTHQAKVGPMAQSAQAAAPDALASYRRVVAGLQAAESRHDFVAKYRFERQLRGMLTADVIGSIYLERSRLLESLASSRANRGYVESRIAQDLRDLCGPAAVKAQLDFCN